MEQQMLKVSGKSRSTAVAGAIAGVLREDDKVTVQAIGAGAVNQALKAIAIARSYLAGDDMDLFVVPGFVETQIEGEDKTAMRLHVESRQRVSVPEELRVEPRARENGSAARTMRGPGGKTFVEVLGEDGEPDELPPF